ncbi:DUF2059 domain-containing protein [Curvibacter sp. CHRR-16]|uniref:DUF2059 domain-containing protein n=1 Tax=Curvibacter sp. CHRR-16 TaxID=2835872 RepID=UPI001BD9F584|nr:DUF2059 domain-containing protein [Curvibacter sp. CHRR-16]MBT0570370.1 DUF2059 domain-containing protein [Curvibacter sp. CHRR-16]
MPCFIDRAAARGVALRLATVAMMAVTASVAMASPVQESTLDAFFRVTRQQEDLQAIAAQVGNMTDLALRQSLQGQTLNEAQLQALAKMRQRTMAVLGEQLAWERLRPEVSVFYKNTFSDEELRAITAFYETPAGQALLLKMPQVLQQSRQAGQRAAVMIKPQLDKIRQEAAEELKAAQRNGL